MKIQLAENYGFCFGVKRAIKIAEENKNSATYGPLIHNAHEIDRLKRDFNVALSENLESFKSGDTAVIRTHGIPKEELSLLHERKVNVIDATCPYVTKPQQICEEMSEQGYDILIFGDESHPEIKGVKSYASGTAYVVNSVEEVDGLHLRENRRGGSARRQVDQPPRADPGGDGGRRDHDHRAAGRPGRARYRPRHARLRGRRGADWVSMRFFACFFLSIIH